MGLLQMGNAIPVYGLVSDLLSARTPVTQALLKQPCEQKEFCRR